MQSSYSWIEADLQLVSPYLKLFRDVVNALDSISLGDGSMKVVSDGVYVEYRPVIQLSYHR